LFDSWRPALNFFFIVNQRFNLNFNSSLAANRHMPSVADINFKPTSQFTLAAEGNRPVFVTPASVVPISGAVAWTSSRASSLFAHVSESRSDLRGETRTIGGSVNYNPFFTGSQPSYYWFASAGYAYSDAREQSRG